MLGRFIALLMLLVIGGGALTSPASADPRRHRRHHRGGGPSFFSLATPWVSLSFGRSSYGGRFYNPGYGGYNPYDWGYTGPFYTGRGYTSDYFIPPPGIYRGCR